MKLIGLMITFLSFTASAQEYFCILARMENGVPVEYDRKESNLSTESIHLEIRSGYKSTVEIIQISATEYQPETKWLAVNITGKNGVKADSLYTLEQIHTLLKMTDGENGVSTQCSKH